MTDLCFATNNKHKLYEVRAAMPPEIRILSLEEINCHEELPETRDTLEGNSLQKAEYVLEHYGVPCFADDSGLEVEALGGAPGVYSARYAGPQRNSEDNINFLLSKLSNQRNRKAQFRTVFSLVRQTQTPLLFEGIVRGEIILSRRGTEGFGYDPIFRPDEFDKTFAEMTIEEKNQISHRAIAVQKLIQYLRENNLV